MITDNLIPIGYQALVFMFNLIVIPHYRASYITNTGGRRTFIHNVQEVHIYPKDYLPTQPNDPFVNLEFALKHEGINLAIIKTVFEKLNQVEIVAYINKSPHGRAERKIWYLYEFLMHQKLPIADLKQGNYIDLQDSDNYYSTKPIKKRRQRINDNLLGFSYFCPFVRRTKTLTSYEKKDLDIVAQKMLADYEQLITERAAAYLYTKETLSSWRIEREEPSKARAQNFVTLLRSVNDIEDLSKKELIEIQRRILDPRFAELDYRKTQNYIAESIKIGYSIIHYISPRPEDVPLMMQDLLLCLQRMIESNVSPVIVATVISFGFVYIHPFEDGNGRLHRFLIHYILSRMHFTPQGIIFPLSATILAHQKHYDKVLELFSKPLMGLLDYQEDNKGIIIAKNNHAALYAYLDYTLYTEYLFACIEKTIQTDLKKELLFIVVVAYDETKKAIQDIADIPDKQIDLLIKCIMQNNGTLSQSKREKLFGYLTDREVDAIQAVVKNKMPTLNL